MEYGPLSPDEWRRFEASRKKWEEAVRPEIEAVRETTLDDIIWESDFEASLFGRT